MKSVLVSIISGQTIPNLLLIKEFAGKFDELLFITSFEMEGRGNIADSRSRWIERSCKIAEGTTRRIEVAEDCWADISEKLKSLNDDADVQYIVNLTGGTKIMTLAIFEYFARRGNTIYYIPFPKNEYHELYPAKNKCHKLSYRCNLKEYLMAHGLHYTHNEELLAPPAETLAFFEKVKKANFDFQAVPEIVFAHDFLDKGKKAYYSGIWFEEYVYHKLREVFKLSVSNIAMGVKLVRDPKEVENDNEYDVMFIRSNTLHVIECKGSAGRSKKASLDRYLYKLGAITKNFGLKVNTYLFTLTNLSDSYGNILKNIDKGRQILGIKGIFDQKFFDKSNEYIKQLK